MRDIEAAIVDEAIFHRIERTDDGEVFLRLSETSIRTDDNELDVLDYLGKHIRASVGDNGAVAANIGDDALPISHALEMALEPATYVDASKDLARHLYEQVKKDKRISDGTLAVVRYRPLVDEVTGPGSLAIMKLDPSVQFTVEEETTASGVRITLRPVESVLPSVRERLQKAAFLRPTTDHEYRMLVLDRQTRGDDVASWFMSSFLGAEPATTDQTRTDDFYRAVSLIEQELGDDLGERERRHLAAARDQALRDATVDTRRWVENRSELTDDQKATAERVLQRELTDREFTVHRSTADKLLRRARYEGDEGLVVTIPTEFEDRVGQVQTDPNTGESFVRIRTSKLERTK